MNANNSFSDKLSYEEKSSGKNSNERNEDIKPNLEMISKNIKKEPDFTIDKNKKELGSVVREIKKEPCFSDTEVVTTNFMELPSISRRKKQKATKKVRKRASKVKKRAFKKCRESTQTKETKRSFISKRSTKKRKTRSKRKSGKKSRSIGKSLKTIKKETHTLLDRQNNGSLHLFGFKDELEYFSLESDHEEIKEISSERDIIGKRTRLSSLDARKKVVLALKATPPPPCFKPKAVIQPFRGKNVDLLSSILESQALWHSKNSHMKVNDDGSIEVISKRNKTLVEKEVTSDKKSNLQKETNDKVSSEIRNEPSCTKPITILPVMHESLNLNDNIETHLAKVNVKIEPHNSVVAWSIETVIDDSKEKPGEEKIKVEGKEKKKESPNSLPSVLPLQESSISISESTLINSPKIEKFDDEDDCPIISIYSRASKIFSLKRDKERQIKFVPDQSEIQIIEIKESEDTEGKKRPSKRHKNYQEKETERKRQKSISQGKEVKVKKERETITCITIE